MKLKTQASSPTIHIDGQKPGYLLLAAVNIIAMMAYPKPEEADFRNRFAEAFIANHVKTQAKSSEGACYALNWPDIITVRRSETIESRSIDQINIRLSRCYQTYLAVLDLMQYASAHGMVWEIDTSAGTAFWTPSSPGTPRKFAEIRAAAHGSTIKGFQSRAVTNYNDCRPILHLILAFFDAASRWPDDNVGGNSDRLVNMLNAPESWVRDVLARAEQFRTRELAALNVDPSTAVRIVIDE